MEIYAELSRKQYRQVISGEYEICVPHGVVVRNRRGSRAIFFDCDTDDTAKDLIEGLDASAINWQANDEWEEKKDEDTENKSNRSKPIYTESQYTGSNVTPNDIYGQGQS